MTRSDPPEGPPDLAAIAAEIRRVLVAELGVAPARLDGAGADMPLLGGGLSLDSMEALVLVTGLERAFGFETADEELTADAFTTLGTLAERARGWIARERGN